MDQLLSDDWSETRHQPHALLPEPLSKRRRIMAVSPSTANQKNSATIKREGTLPEDVAASRCGKPHGISMIEFLTAKQVREHIISLRQWVGQRNEETEGTKKNCCELCMAEKLVLHNVPIYCRPCGAPIKKLAKYYVLEAAENKHAVCDNCFQGAREEVIEIDNWRVPKAHLNMKRFDEGIEEKWVQCYKCHARHHQICGLINELQSNGAQLLYTCPKCYNQELKRGERVPLPESAMLGAKDIPRTRLSDFVENRLFERLRMERRQRADSLKKRFEDVPGAEGLILRVVSSVDMEVKVKARFSEFFEEESYPTHLPYKSKALVLFQKIDGVEVLLFTMFVQEFGTECAFPNQRDVYLAYVDSVKYFKPDVKTTDGEALRTFVYHEVLIGYLDWCKKRGFSRCFLWSCPPRKGIEYIFYCHPEVQRTPKSNRLREWYLSMLKKGMKENIVVGLTNLYDHFFTHQGESRAKITATRLPYFEGDYWPWVAEEVIYKLLREDKDLNQQMTKCANLSVSTPKDAKLMQKLGEAIYPKKDDLIMVLLQHPCNHCGNIMVSGTRWACNSCQCFNLCDWCHDLEQLCEDWERHPSNSKDKHTFSPVEIVGVPTDTKDEDAIIERGIFHNASAFLSLCQGRHYQFDTLRRAKHSSMMLVHHLHYPTMPT